MIVSLEYLTGECLQSCSVPNSGIQPGEEVIVTLKPKDPSWPEKIRATVVLPFSQHDNGQWIYTLQYDSDFLSGGVMPQSCDIESVNCYSCCDAMHDRLQNLITALPVVENDDGSFTYTP